ncbi:MAG: diacylglycerol kinase family protein [Bacteroidota bacterium]
MSIHHHVTFIVNPAAGRGKAKHLAEKLSLRLQNNSVPHTILSTERPGHGTELAREASNTSDYVVAVGGDGTVNEVASGLVNTPATLAVLSEGSGNDFARLVNAPSKIQHVIDLVLSSKRTQFDCGKAKVFFDDGTTAERYFFNTLGVGFDAAVAYHVAEITWLRGIPLYAVALVQTLVGYHPHRFTVASTEYRKDDNYFLVCVGNGMWEGGGFKVTPDAVPDDGKFQVCCVRGNSVLTVLPILPSTMTGGHVRKSIVDTFDTETISIESDKPFPVHGDGEIFGLNIKKIDISILPKSLNVAVIHK